jgi:hypothetical protein
MLRVLMVTFFFGLVAFPARAEFLLDVERETVLERLGVMAIQSLAVGEKGFVSNWAICRSNNDKMMLNALARLDLEPSEYSPQARVKRHPGNKFEVGVRPGTEGYGKNKKPQSMRDAVHEILVSLYVGSTCEILVMFYPNQYRPIPVESFVGLKKLSEWLR